MILLSACQKEDDYKPLDVEIVENTKTPVKSTDEYIPQINGLYELTDDTDIFDKPEDKDPFDKIGKGSTVKILGEAENGFVRVDYFGNTGYIKVANLKEI